METCSKGIGVVYEAEDIEQLQGLRKELVRSSMGCCKVQNVREKINKGFEIRRFRT